MATWFAMLIETDEDAAASASRELEDPKHILRHELATRGVVTQFISETSSPRSSSSHEFTDHPAASAVVDLLRSAGFFLRAFPNVGKIDVGTAIIGVYGTRVTRQTSGKPHAVYAVNLVATLAGSRAAYGYSARSGWKPLHDATAGFIAQDLGMTTPDEARAYGERAVAQFRVAFGATPRILLFDGAGCRQGRQAGRVDRELSVHLLDAVLRRRPPPGR